VPQPVLPASQRRAWISRPIFFGWYIVASGVLIEAFGYGCRYSFSVFFPTLIDRFGWPRDMTASILSTHLLFYGLTAPLTGYLVDRVGFRKTMLSGTTLLAAGLILSRWGTSPWHFFFTYGVLTGAGLCLLGSVSLTMVLKNWFEHRRGMAISLVYCGSGAAYGCYPLVAWLIDSLGWRDAFLAEGIFILVLFAPLISLTMISHPAKRGLTKDGLGPGRGRAFDPTLESRRIVDHSWAGIDWTLGRAVGTTRFWLLCLSTFSMWGLGNHILITHQIAFAMDMGYPRLYASAVLSLNGLMFGLGTLISLASDRIGREPTMIAGTLLSATGILALTLITGSDRPWLLYYYSLSTGIGFGISVPVTAAIVTDIFQGPRVGLVVGMIWFSFALGGAVGPWLGGLLFEAAGNYHTAFILALLAYLVGGGTICLAAPRKVRLVPGRAALRPAELSLE
jgi:MFS family permease